MKKHNIVIKYQTESDITEYHCNMIIFFFFFGFIWMVVGTLWCVRCHLLTIYSSWMLPIFDLIFFFSISLCIQVTIQRAKPGPSPIECDSRCTCDAWMVYLPFRRKLSTRWSAGWKSNLKNGNIADGRILYLIFCITLFLSFHSSPALRTAFAFSSQRHPDTWNRVLSF